MEEIKAGEIMIGNYYCYQFNDKICKVESIVKDDRWQGGYKVISECGQITGIAACCPIPLTEDILLKVGANVITIDNKNSYTPNGYVGRVFKIGEFKCYIDRKQNRWAYRATMIEDVKYLHQLQNLFKSLTGSDLKIEV